MSLDRERWIQLAKANAEVIRAEVTRIKTRLENKDHIHFAEFWAEAREITSMFKTFKPLEVEEREKLWTEFHALCEETRSLQEDHRIRTKRASKRKKAAVEVLIQEASAIVQGEDEDKDLDKAQAILNKALDLMKTRPAKGQPPAAVPESEEPSEEDVDGIRLIRSDREACWKQWVEVRETVKALRKALRSEVAKTAREEASEILTAAEQDDPHEVQNRVKAMQQELKTSPLSNNEREKVRAMLRNAWEKASDRIGEEKQEKKRKHQEWAERMKEHLVRWETTVLKNDVVHGRIRSEIVELEERVEASGDEAQNEKMLGWIREKGERLEKLEAAKAELEEKIRVVRSKLGKDAPEPITELPPEVLEAPPPPSRRPRKRAEAPRKPSQPPPSPGLNLGEVLAQTLLKDDETPRSGVSLGELLSEKLGAAVGADDS
jgi:hypothetical protein